LASPQKSLPIPALNRALQGSCTVLTDFVWELSGTGETGNSILRLFNNVSISVLTHYTELFKALVQYIGTLLGKIIGKENVNEFSSDSLPFRICFNVYVAFITVIVKFYKMETVRFDIKCQLIPLLQ
jgi:hypothetical protein